MSVKTVNEILEQIRATGNTDDSTIALIEDVTDTFNDLESKARQVSGDDWKKKYEDCDRKWREKYIERFSNSEKIDNPIEIPSEMNKPKKYSYESLFK